MPVHDWTRVNAGTFHDFHNAWIIHLKEAFNSGLLPDAYYAISEQQRGFPGKHLSIRHTRTHQLVAMIEILSPENKDCAPHIARSVDKARSAIDAGCHLLLADLLPTGGFDPDGIHAMIWDRFGGPTLPETEKLFMLASYRTLVAREAYLEPVGIGDRLPEMPLFLSADCYINVPLEATYGAAYRGMPAYWRAVLEGNEIV